MWEFVKLMLWAFLFFAVLGVLAAVFWGLMGERVTKFFDDLRPKNKAQSLIYSIIMIVVFFWLVLKFPIILEVFGYHP